MSQDKETKKVEVKDLAVCAYVNRGVKSNPYLYIATCCDRLVNIKKQLVRNKRLPEKCMFCNNLIDWRRKGNV